MMSPKQLVTFNLPELTSTRTMTFPGNYASLAAIADFVRQAAKDQGLDDFATYMVETAVDEACSNIIEHAYGGENVGEIEVTAQINPDNLTLVLHDKGRPFQPENIPEPDIHASLEEMPGHGLGLFFIRKWMDEVSFSFSQEYGNRLTMVKRKERKA